MVKRRRKEWSNPIPSRVCRRHNSGQWQPSVGSSGKTPVKLGMRIQEILLDVTKQPKVLENPLFRRGPVFTCTYLTVKQGSVSTRGYYLLIPSERPWLQINIVSMLSHRNNTYYAIIWAYTRSFLWFRSYVHRPNSNMVLSGSWNVTRNSLMIVFHDPNRR